MFKKLLASFLAIILAAVMVLTVSFARYSDTIFSQDVLDAYRKSAESIANQCDNYIIGMQRDLLSLAISDGVQVPLRRFDADTAHDFSELNQPGRSFNSRIFPIVADTVYFQGENGVYLPDAAQSEETWVLQTIERNGRLNLAVVELDETRFIRFSMLVKDTENYDRPLGILAADIQLDTFVVFIGKSALGSSDYMVLVDDQQVVQYPYQTGTTLSTQKILTAVEGGSFSDEDRVFWSSPIARSSWHLVLSYSTHSIQARTSTLYKVALGISAVAAVFAFAIALFFSYWHAKPITNLSRHIKSKSLEQIDVPAKLNKDYLSLYANYNEMVNQINSLLSELYETNKRERETQLKMLQAQLNPHFIYNVLDSINWMSMKYQAKDIQMMVSSLATMLRCSLNSGRDILNVEQEIRQIQSYLSIQSYRYDNAMQVIYDFSPDIMHKKMIKLLLQPLVENAINHGLETYNGKKLLKISGHLDGDLLVFEVGNTGHRPDLERIEQILSGNQQVTTSYGIRNVNERIKTTYGQDYGLRYRVEGEWIIANITVPSEPI